MFKDRDKMYQVYHTILSMALTWGFILAINDYFTLRVHVVVCMVFALIPAVLVAIFDTNRKNTVSYLILLSIFPVTGMFFWIRGINPISWIRSITNWCYEYDGSKELYITSHAHFLVLGIALVVTILFYIIMKNLIAKVVLAAGIFGTLIILSIITISINKIVIGIDIFYLLSILFELSGKIYSKKNGRPEKKSGILYLAPICLILAVFSVSLPSKQEPIQWRGVKAFYYNIRDRIDILITEWEFLTGNGPGEFALSMTGYSEENGNLGQGSLSKDDKIALMITGTKGNSPIYLIGSVRDIYTGSSWEKSRKDHIEGEKEYLLDYGELVYALSRQDPKVLEDNRFVERRNIKVTYHNIKTKTFFYPGKSSWYEIKSNNKSPLDDTANIIFPKAAGEGTTYQDTYYEINLNGAAFQQMIREADRFSYDRGEDIDAQRVNNIEKSIFALDKAKTILSQQDFYELLRKRANMIHEEFTGLPDSLPERVRKLALEITKDEATTFDKLKAIEQYLLTYTYHLQPGKLPQGEDFVDYFLFDNRQGFCTSFASAMAILGRCVDIPTRYVEGYIVDYEDSKDNSFLVRNSRAHSWAEAYIEGIGWIPFEATPPFYGTRYTAWREYKKGDNSDKIDYSEFLRNQMKENMEETIDNELVKSESKEDMPGSLIGGIIIFTTLLTSFLLLILYYIVLKYKYQKDLNKADYSRKVYLYFIRILAMLQKEGYRLDPQETIGMLADRVKDRYHYDRITFQVITEIFMRYRYGEESLTEEDYKKVEIFHLGLTNKQREETGRIKMHLEEFKFLAKKGNR